MLLLPFDSTVASSALNPSVIGESKGGYWNVVLECPDDLVGQYFTLMFNPNMPNFTVKSVGPFLNSPSEYMHITVKQYL